MKMKSRPLKILSMYLWNVIPAFLSPKGIRRNSKRPKGVMMAVLGTADSSRGTCR